MKASMSLIVDFDIDPQKVERVIKTEGMSASAAKKALRARIWQELDTRFTSTGNTGDYLRDIRDDILEILEDLDVLEDGKRL